MVVFFFYPNRGNQRVLDFMCNPKLVHILVKLKGQNELGQKLASPTKLCPDFFGETRYVLYYHMARQSAPR